MTETIPSPVRRRDAQRTRRALLDAAAVAVADHGAGVSLDVIARTAGVSKSGLLHHYASKDDLFLALAVDAYERFSRQVDAATDPSDLAPGRLARGYVRATFADLLSPAPSPDFWAVQGQLTLPAIRDATRRDYADWQTRLSADGLDPCVVRLVLLATTGAEVTGTIGAALGASLLEVRDGLLRLTLEPDAVADVLRGHVEGDPAS